MIDISRRTLIKRTGAAGAAMLPVVAPGEAPAQQHGRHDASPPPPAAQTHTDVPPADTHSSPPQTTYLFFNSQEAAFIEAAVARLIPKDEQWDGALEAGRAEYIDKQLAGAWGAGGRPYRSGPSHAGTPRP